MVDNAPFVVIVLVTCYTGKTFAGLVREGCLHRRGKIEKFTID